MSDEENPQTEATTAVRGRSTIDFPYSDLDGAIEMADALHREAGYECTTDQLAGFISMTGSSGGFRLRLGTTRTFGLIETQRGGAVFLTDLGSKIVDSEQRDEALIEAFLNVPLYKAIFEQFKSKLLPPRKGLERQMEALGVSPKQKGKARQAFERSARQAGFFWQGEDRLVMPVIRRGRSRPGDNKAVELPTASIAPLPRTSGMHPFIEGLLDSLPEPQSEWSTVEQAKWLQTAAGIFGLLYKSADGKIDVSVSSSDHQLP